MGNCVPRSKPKATFNAKPDVLHVISVVFNPAGFSTRVELYKKFAAEMACQPNVVLWTVECLFPGQTEYTVTQRGNPHHLQLCAQHRIWLKENLINIVVQRCLPRDWKYMAWVDGDLLFHDGRVAEKTINALQVHPVVQMWERVNFLGPRGEVLEVSKSFGSYCHGRQTNNAFDQANFDKAYPHPGFAWAMTRAAYNYITGLPQFSIVGNGDNHFAYALLGRVKESIPEAAWGYVSAGHWKMLEQLNQLLVNMQRTLAPHMKLGPGYIPGMMISHMWHGDWRDRGYVMRWQCLVVDRVTFDPFVHLRVDANGTVMLSDYRFLRSIEGYFASRKEDSKAVVTDHANKHQNAPRLPQIEPLPARRGGNAPVGRIGKPLPARGGNAPVRHNQNNYRKQQGRNEFDDDYDYYDTCVTSGNYHHHHNDHGHHGHGHCHNDDGHHGHSHDVFSSSHAAYC
eukprot:TRINITY_DN8048_c0_g1_i3.p1 TRINITY_DN8048_c0_g1~~TRINITY_DN8048_c0_g1_i3.p1  ORF type:complete len:454 (+),score=102.12 TRINITY_DN8048_c0_g1_i3:52-1413(+)